MILRVADPVRAVRCGGGWRAARRGIPCYPQVRGLARKSGSTPVLSPARTTRWRWPTTAGRPYSSHRLLAYHAPAVRRLAAFSACVFGSFCLAIYHRCRLRARQEEAHETRSGESLDEPTGRTRPCPFRRSSPSAAINSARLRGDPSTDEGQPPGKPKLLTTLRVQEEH